MPSKKPAGQKEKKGAAAPARAAKKAAPQSATKGGVAASAPKARTGAKVSAAGKTSADKSASKAPAKAAPAKSKAGAPKAAPAKTAAKAPAKTVASPKAVSKTSTAKPRPVQEVLALETTKVAAPQRAAANTPASRRSSKTASGTRRASARRDPKDTVPSERFSPLEKTSKRKAEAEREIDGPVPRSKLLEGELPGQYGVDRLVAMPKDPEWTHLYWEISPETQQRISSHGEGAFHVRGFDTTNVLFDGTNAPVSLDIEVAPYARSWYVRLPYQGRVYTFEYGLADSRGEWKPLARSQPVGYHPGMSDLGSEEWISIASEELFRLSAGLDGQEGISDLIRRLRERSMPGSWGGASEVLSGRGGAFWLTSWGSGMGRLEFAPSSWMTSPMGSGTSWGAKGAGVQVPGKKGKDFWLWVETELILYGATEPDAKVTVRGEPIQLSPDGTFWMKFPFPDGTNYLLDVQAIDRDGDQVRSVAPAAKRWTE